MRFPVLTHFAVCLGLTAVAPAQGTRADYARAAAVEKGAAGKVFRTRVNPRWAPDGSSFWYRIEAAPGRIEIVQVDAATGARTLLDAAPGVADPGAAVVAPEAKSRGGGEEIDITFLNETGGEVKFFWVDPNGRRKAYGALPAGQQRTLHTFAYHVWRVEAASGQLIGLWEGRETGAEIRLGRDPVSTVPAKPPRSENPDGSEWRGFIRDHNVWLKHRPTGGEHALSTDGRAADEYLGPVWVSPDGQKVAVLQVEPAQTRRVAMVESSPKDRVEPRWHEHNYLKPGDRIAHPRLRLFDLATWSAIPVTDELFPTPWSLTEVRWSPDSSRVTFLYNQRGHQLLRVLAADATTGAVRTLVEESSPTFVDYSQKTWLRFLDQTDELLWASERDGWNHLYLFDSRTGALKRQITRGEWVVRDVERVDEGKRQIWFRAGGIRPGHDPYYTHLARVNLDGTGLTILTDGEGTRGSKHGNGEAAGWRFSPDGRTFLDTYSRVDLPPVTELRRAQDGALIATLERADASQLLQTGWRPPERFAAKGRDGKTDIFGLIIRPSNFDPARKYPVVESIYAGPHDFFVPKEWGSQVRQRALAELGFIVVQIDGMGTNWRSRAFHDVAWRNLKDGGFPDRIAWMKAAAATVCPQMDLTRVGIFGGSAGGQNALAAMLHHGDFYQAAVADCGCHDNRMDKIWWNEAWMGWPIGREYADNSNVTHAAKLTGRLLLTVGELDRNVDPASTMQVVNALVAADKDFEMLVIPGADHGAGEQPYAARRRADFFVRALLGVEPRAR